MKVNNNIKLGAISQKKKIAIQLYGETASKRLEDEAKKSAPWVDRTGNARNSLRGSFKMTNNKAKISLSGNMEYSVYLELAMEKRYAVILPTIKANQVEIIRNFAKVVFE